MMTNNMTLDTESDLFPVTVCDSRGSVIRKNRRASGYKMFRVHSKIIKLITMAQRDEFLICLAERKVGLFNCERNDYFSYAAVFPQNDGLIAVFWIAYSLCENDIFDPHKQDDYFQNLECFDKILKEYISQSQKADGTADLRAHELLKNNSLRISRATRHFEMYIRSIARKDQFDKEPRSLVDLSELCRKLTSYADSRLPGGHVSFEDYTCYSVIPLQKEFFLNVFSDMMTMALRMSADGNIHVTIRECDEKIVFSFGFCPNDSIAATRDAVYSETEFLRNACSERDWTCDIPIIKSTDQTAQVYLVLPSHTTKNFTCRVPETAFEESDKSLHRSVDESFSFFYFCNRFSALLGFDE